MKKILPLIVVGIFVLSGLGAVAFNINISKEEIVSSFLDELDQSQEVMTENLVIPIGQITIPENPPIYVQVAQSFIPTKDIITRVELLIGKNATTTYPLTIAIREELLQSDLTTVLIDPGMVPTEAFDWVECDFNDILITPGQTYYIVALTDNVTDNYYAWGGNNISESYPDGCAWFSLDEGNSWGNQSSSSDVSNIEEWILPGSKPNFDDYVTWDMCFRTYGRLNSAPEAPIITGPAKGTVGVEYDFTFNTTDPDGDQIYLWIEWFPGCPGIFWEGPFDSGVDVVIPYTYTQQGTFTITAIPKDIWDVQGPAGQHIVTMPRSKVFNMPFLRFLNNHQNLFPVIRQIFGL
jgi:hypothetical protein